MKQDTINIILEAMKDPELVKSYIKKLKDFDIDDDKGFEKIFLEMVNEKFTVTELLNIHKGIYGKDPYYKQKQKILESIKTLYYERIYDRDANNMAKRATPW